MRDSSNSRERDICWHPFLCRLQLATSDDLHFQLGVGDLPEFRFTKKESRLRKGHGMDTLLEVFFFNVATSSNGLRSTDTLIFCHFVGGISWCTYYICDICICTCVYIYNLLIYMYYMVPRPITPTQLMQRLSPDKSLYNFHLHQSIFD